MVCDLSVSVPTRTAKKSYRDGRVSAASVVLRPVLAPLRPAAPFHRRHPGRGPASAFTTARREALQSDDGLFKVLTLRPKLGEHFLDFHSPRIAYCGLDPLDKMQSIVSKYLPGAQAEIPA